MIEREIFHWFLAREDDPIRHGQAEPVKYFDSRRAVPGFCRTGSRNGVTFATRVAGVKRGQEYEHAERSICKQ